MKTHVVPTEIADAFMAHAPRMTRRASRLACSNPFAQNNPRPQPPRRDRRCF